MGVAYIVQTARLRSSGVVLGVLFLLFLLFFTVTEPDDIARKALGEKAPPEVVAVSGSRTTATTGRSGPGRTGRRISSSTTTDACSPSTSASQRRGRLADHPDRHRGGHGAEPLASPCRF